MERKGVILALGTLIFIVFATSSLVMKTNMQSVYAQPIFPCNQSICEKEHREIESNLNATSSALRSGDVNGAQMSLENAQILLKKHEINERANSPHNFTIQAEGENTTQPRVKNDKMGVCEKVLCLYVDMVVNCSSNINSCPNASQYTLAAQPAALANPTSFQGKCCGECCGQIVFFQYATESYSITVTNTPSNGGKIEYGNYCKGGLEEPAIPPNTCTVTATVS
jgi:cell division protein FtsL